MLWGRGVLLVALVDVESPVLHVWADELENVPAVGSLLALPDEAGSMEGQWRVLSHEEAEPVWRRGRRAVRVNVIRPDRYSGPNMTASV